MTDGERAYRGLKPKYAIFVDRVAAGGDQGKTWAGIFSSSGASADVAASKWLSKAKNRAALNWRREQAAVKAGITIERVMHVLACIVESDPLDVEPYLLGEKPMDGVPVDARLAITGTKLTRTTRTRPGSEEVEVEERREIRRETKTAAARLLLEALGGLKRSPEAEKADALREIADAMKDNARAKIEEALARRREAANAGE